MQNNSKEIEVKNNIIDLTKDGTFGAKKKYDIDDDFPFLIGSDGHWLWGVPDEEKLIIFLDKMNQTDKYYRFSSVEHVVEEVFNQSKMELYFKTKASNEYLAFMPERKDQYVFDEKLKVFNENKEIGNVLKNESVATVTDDCFLDLEKSKQVFISHTFLGLGFKNVPEIYTIIKLIIKYRCNLLYMEYLNQLSAPAPKAEAQGDDIFNFDKEIEILMKSENKFHKGLLMDDVINHFKVFYERKNKVNEFYLTKESFVSFIKRGFLNDDNQPTQKINFSTSEKGFVMLRFYEFYTYAVNSCSLPAKKEIYIQLILKCFDNLGVYSAVKSGLKRSNPDKSW